jgi:hypothetical protein
VTVGANPPTEASLWAVTFILDAMIGTKPSKRADAARLIVAALLLLPPCYAQDDCPAGAFTCSASLDGVITPSWCSFYNPLIVAKPPSALATGASAPYYCSSEKPFEPCTLIDNFYAGEALAYPNAATKVIMVAQ